MNERIRELAEQSYIEVPHERDWDATSRVFDKEKFAELIIMECMLLADNEASRLYNMNEDDCGAVMENYRELIKQHFGVKE